MLCVMLTDLLACSVGIPLKTASSATFFNFSPKTGTPITSVMVVGKTERDKKSLIQKESMIIMVVPGGTRNIRQMHHNLQGCCLNFLKVSTFCS